MSYHLMGDISGEAQVQYSSTGTVFYSHVILDLVWVDVHPPNGWMYIPPWEDIPPPRVDILNI